MNPHDRHNRFSVSVRSSGAAVIAALLLLVMTLPAAESMDISRSAVRIREMINMAIDTRQITRAEYDMIFRIALEDGVIDKHEQALLDQLQEYIEDKTIKFVFLRTMSGGNGSIASRTPGLRLAATLQPPVRSSPEPRPNPVRETRFG